MAFIGYGRQICIFFWLEAHHPNAKANKRGGYEIVYIKNILAQQNARPDYPEQGNQQVINADFADRIIFEQGRP